MLERRFSTDCTPRRLKEFFSSSLPRSSAQLLMLVVTDGYRNGALPVEQWFKRIEHDVSNTAVFLSPECGVGDDKKRTLPKTN